MKSKQKYFLSSQPAGNGPRCSNMMNLKFR